MLLTPDQGISVPTKVTDVDNLMQQLHNKLTITPIGTHYVPSSSPAASNVTPDGGTIPTVRRFRILTDKILIPYRDNTGPTVGQDGFLEGDVTEADLRAAGCNVQYLIDLGHIVEDGYMRI